MLGLRGSALRGTSRKKLKPMVLEIVISGPDLSWTGGINFAPWVHGGRITVDWGDGQIEVYEDGNFPGLDSSIDHTYPSAGTYIVQITGQARGADINNLSFFNSDGHQVTIISFGDFEFFDRFELSRNLNGIRIHSLTVPRLGKITNFTEAFRGADFNAAGASSLQYYNTSNITSMNNCFSNVTGADNLAGNIDNWNTTNVIDLVEMFNLSDLTVDMDLSSWDVGNVVSFAFCFRGISSSSLGVDNWNVSSAVSFSSMFRDCTNFNDDISGWQIEGTGNGRVDAPNMFDGASSFNADIKFWNARAFRNSQLTGFLQNATSFNRDLRTWDVIHIGTAPTNFSTGSAISAEPIWGTNGESVTLLGPSTVNEGDSITITLDTTNIANGTVYNYTISGVSSADIGGISLSGSFTVGSATTLNVTFSNDLVTEGVETFTISTTGGEATLNIDINDTSVPTYDSFSSSSNILQEGDTITITAIGTGVQDGVTTNYTISGLTSADYTAGNGFLLWSGGTGTDTITFANDFITEGDEVVIITLDSTDSDGNATGGLQAGPFTLSDTSTSNYSVSWNGSSVNEGASAIATVSTTNVPDGTTIDYTLSGTNITAAELGLTSLTGTLTINSNQATLTLNISADTTTEGNEQLTISLASTDSRSSLTGSPSAVIVISDTSITPGGWWTTFQDQRQTNPGNLNQYMDMYRLAIASDDAIVSCGVLRDDYFDPGNITSRAVLICQNSNGSVRWIRQFTSDDGNDFSNVFYDVKVDSNDNAIAVGMLFQDPFAVSVSMSDGSVNWNRKFEGQSLYRRSFFARVILDSNDNIYATGRHWDTNDRLYVSDTKLANSNGNILWQRRMWGNYLDGSVLRESYPDGLNYAQFITGTTLIVASFWNVNVGQLLTYTRNINTGSRSAHRVYDQGTASDGTTLIYPQDIAQATGGAIYLVGGGVGENKAQAYVLSTNGSVSTRYSFKSTTSGAPNTDTPTRIYAITTDVGFTVAGEHESNNEVIDTQGFVHNNAAAGLRLAYDSGQTDANWTGFRDLKADSNGDFVFLGKTTRYGSGIEGLEANFRTARIAKIKNSGTSATSIFGSGSYRDDGTVDYGYTQISGFANTISGNSRTDENNDLTNSSANIITSEISSVYGVVSSGLLD